MMCRKDSKATHPSTSPFLTIKVDLQPLFLIKSSFSLKKWKGSSSLCFSAYINPYLYLCSTQTSHKRQNHIENGNHIHGIHRKGCNGSGSSHLTMLLDTTQN
ncbi:hypothetical protein YC2023_058945 [Brassica napus]